MRLVVSVLILQALTGATEPRPVALGEARIEGRMDSCAAGQYPVQVLDLSTLKHRTAGRVEVSETGDLQGAVRVEGACTAFLILDQMRVVPFYLRPGKTFSITADAGHLEDGVSFARMDAANALSREFSAALDVTAFPLKSDTPDFVSQATRMREEARSKIATARETGGLDDVDAAYLSAAIDSRVEYAFEMHARFKKGADSSAALLEFSRGLVPVSSDYLRADGGWVRPLQLLYEEDSGDPEDLGAWLRFVSQAAGDEAARHYMLGRCAVRRLEGLAGSRAQRGARGASTSHRRARSRSRRGPGSSDAGPATRAARSCDPGRECGRDGV